MNLMEQTINKHSFPMRGTGKAPTAGTRLHTEPGDDPSTVRPDRRAAGTVGTGAFESSQTAAGLAGGFLWGHTWEETDAGSRVPCGGHS